MNMQLNKHDYEMIADILDAHYEDKVDLQKLEYLEKLIDKVVYMIHEVEEPTT